MDSSTSVFPLFPLLPKELRTSIWEHAIMPRVIPFERQLYYFSPQHAPSFIYLLGGDYPFTHFTFETLERPNSPYYTAHLEPVNVQYPTILEVCHESREAAIAQGYKPWHITNHLREVKNLMWNPKIDVVFLKDSNISGARHPLSAPRPGLDLFFEQFPEQVREVQKIVFWSSYWPRFLQFSTDIMIPLMRFETLKEFIVIIDDTWERECLDDGRLWRSWEIPKDIVASLSRIEQRAGGLSDFTPPTGGWKVPAVRVVRSLEGILEGENEEMEIRCENCVSLG